MSVKTLSWILLAAAALAAAVLFNYWAPFEPLSVLAYSGMAAALFGVANLALPFRFLGIRRRYMGVLIFAGGGVLSFTALLWPASMLRVAHPGSLLDEIMPEYQFHERHSIRIHAQPEQVMQAIRLTTFGDMKSLITLLKIRGAFLHQPSREAVALPRDLRILDAFAASGYVSGGSNHEIVTAGGANARARHPLAVHTLQEFAACREPGAVKIAFDFDVHDAGRGWSTVDAETRMAVPDGSSRGPAIYWRLILPGSGLLRRQWLEAIKRRAENEHGRE